MVDRGENIVVATAGAACIYANSDEVQFAKVYVVLTIDLPFLQSTI